MWKSLCFLFLIKIIVFDINVEICFFGQHLKLVFVIEYVWVVWWTWPRHRLSKLMQDVFHDNCRHQFLFLGSNWISYLWKSLSYSCNGCIWCRRVLSRVWWKCLQIKKVRVSVWAIVFCFFIFVFKYMFSSRFFLFLCYHLKFVSSLSLSTIFVCLKY